MPLSTLHIGPFAACYVGLASGLDSAPLIQLTGLTTGAHKVTLDTPEVFNYSAQNSLQAGPVSLNASITFLSDDPQAWRLAAGNFLNAAGQDTPASFVKLMVCLIHPDDTAESSFLFPTCYARKTLPSEWSKSAPTVLPVTFVWQDTSRYNGLYYKRTPTQLQTLMGSRSPF